MKISKAELKQIIQEELEKVTEMDTDDEPEVDYEGNGVEATISGYGKVDDKKYSVTIDIRDPEDYIDEETFDDDLKQLLLPWLIDNFAKADIKV